MPIHDAFGSACGHELNSEVNGTCALPNARVDAERRPHEYLTPSEVKKLIEVARKHWRYGPRNALMILVVYRHGLRVSELCALTWDQVDFAQGLLHARRLKDGMPSVHPIAGEELRSLRALRRRDSAARFVFTTERKAPMTAAGFRKLLARIGEKARMPFLVHPHMLRHACGYKLANDGHDTRALQHYLGHKNITHTVRYSELSHDRFNGFWKD
jgi:type 1 fimbriae regulatory protein FimB/type 1 fimbriae regulatory protein FimE